MITFYYTTTLLSLITFGVYVAYMKYSDKKFIMLEYIMKDRETTKSPTDLKQLIILVIPFINIVMMCFIWYVILCSEDSLKCFMNWLYQNK